MFLRDGPQLCQLFLVRRGRDAEFLDGGSVHAARGGGAVGLARLRVLPPVLGGELGLDLAQFRELAHALRGVDARRDRLLQVIRKVLLLLDESQSDHEELAEEVENVERLQVGLLPHHPLDPHPRAFRLVSSQEIRDLLAQRPRREALLVLEQLDATDAEPQGGLALRRVKPTEKAEETHGPSLRCNLKGRG